MDEDNKASEADTARTAEHDKVYEAFFDLVGKKPPQTYDSFLFDFPNLKNSELLELAMPEGQRGTAQPLSAKAAALQELLEGRTGENSMHPLRKEYEEAGEDDVDDLPSEEGDWVDAAELLKVITSRRGYEPVMHEQEEHIGDDTAASTSAAVGSSIPNMHQPVQGLHAGSATSKAQKSRGVVIEEDEEDEEGVPVVRLRRASSGCVLDAPGQVQVDNFTLDQEVEESLSTAAVGDLIAKLGLGISTATITSDLQQGILVRRPDLAIPLPAATANQSGVKGKPKGCTIIDDIPLEEQIKGRRAPLLQQPPAPISQADTNSHALPADLAGTLEGAGISSRHAVEGMGMGSSQSTDGSSHARQQSALEGSQHQDDRQEENQQEQDGDDAGSVDSAIPEPAAAPDTAAGVSSSSRAPEGNGPAEDALMMLPGALLEDGGEYEAWQSMRGEHHAGLLPDHSMAAAPDDAEDDDRQQLGQKLQQASQAFAATPHVIPCSGSGSEATATTSTAALVMQDTHAGVALQPSTDSAVAPAQSSAEGAVVDPPEEHTRNSEEGQEAGMQKTMQLAETFVDGQLAEAHMTLKTSQVVGIAEVAEAVEEDDAMALALLPAGTMVDVTPVETFSLDPEFDYDNCPLTRRDVPWPLHARAQSKT